MLIICKIIIHHISLIILNNYYTNYNILIYIKNNLRNNYGTNIYNYNVLLQYIIIKYSTSLITKNIRYYNFINYTSQINTNYKYSQLLCLYFYALFSLHCLTL